MRRVQVAPAVLQEVGVPPRPLPPVDEVLAASAVIARLEGVLVAEAGETRGQPRGGLRHGGVVEDVQRGGALQVEAQEVRRARVGGGDGQLHVVRGRLVLVVVAPKDPGAAVQPGRQVVKAEGAVGVHQPAVRHPRGGAVTVGAARADVGEDVVRAWKGPTTLRRRCAAVAEPSKKEEQVRYVDDVAVDARPERSQQVEQVAIRVASRFLFLLLDLFLEFLDLVGI